LFNGRPVHDPPFGNIWHVFVRNCYSYVYFYFYFYFFISLSKPHPNPSHFVFIVFIAFISLRSMFLLIFFSCIVSLQ
jgi:hypothetical protein